MEGVLSVLHVTADLIRTVASSQSPSLYSLGLLSTPEANLNQKQGHTCANMHKYYNICANTNVLEMGNATHLKCSNNLQQIANVQEGF